MFGKGMAISEIGIPPRRPNHSEVDPAMTDDDHDPNRLRTTTRVAVVGGGPGGMMLTYLLGRAGIDVTLLEAADDFDRDFRGDSLHPYTLELLDHLGLADSLLELPHYRARHFRFHTPNATLTTADYGKIRSRFNYVALMPQVRFLDFMAARVAAHPTCALYTGAKVSGLLYDDTGRVTGVRYRMRGENRRLEADLVVGTDGRFSKLRSLSGMSRHKLGACGDLLWFRLPRHDDDPPEADVELYFGRDHYVALLGGPADWQVGYTLPKGGYAAAREAGVEPIKKFVARHVPWLADRVHLLEDFSETTLLSVEISRVEQWYMPGLILLGDAAHVISPVGGNGILMSIQDAVAAANRLVTTYGERCSAPESVLRDIQHDRQDAIRKVQQEQVRIEQRVARARDNGKPVSPPGFLRWVTAIPGVRARAAKANAYGPNPPQPNPELLARQPLS